MRATLALNGLINDTKHARMDQVKLVDDTIKKISNFNCK